MLSHAQEDLVASLRSVVGAALEPIAKRAAQEIEEMSKDHDSEVHALKEQLQGKAQELAGLRSRVKNLRV